jgi:hypothetical protein
MITENNPQQLLINLTVALFVIGAIFLVYGVAVVVPPLYGFLLALRTSLLASVLPAEHPFLQVSVEPVAPSESSSLLLLAGCLFVIGGLFVDLWRRLHRLR